MIVYVDVLVSLNFIIDFLLFSLALKITRIEIKTSRQVLVSIISALSSLYIFLDSQNFLLDLIFRFSFAALFSFLCLGKKYKKAFLKFFLVYISSAFLLGGIIQFFQEILKIPFVSVNNTYVYIGISPIMLILTTFIIYIVVKLFIRFKKTSRLEERCEVRLSFKTTETRFSALIDTGNKVKDILGNGEILFISPDAFMKTVGVTPQNAEIEFKNRFRLIPINTLNGSRIKKGIRIDKANVYSNNQVFEIKNPILVVSDEKLDKDFDVILSSEIFLKVPT